SRGTSPRNLDAGSHVMAPSPILESGVPRAIRSSTKWRLRRWKKRAAFPRSPMTSTSPTSMWRSPSTSSCRILGGLRLFLRQVLLDRLAQLLTRDLSDELGHLVPLAVIEERCGDV